jgi:putative endonuclease
MTKPHGGWVYIMTNRPDGVLYIGVTSDLIRRVHDHREGLISGFTKRYNMKTLVYFERHDDILSAIAREKAMKAWRRDWKIQLIEKGNRDWADLWAGIL